MSTQDMERLVGRLIERGDVDANELAPLVEEEGALDRDLAAVRANPELSALGKAANAERRIAKAASLAERVEQEAERLHAELTRDEEAALHPHVDLSPDDRRLIADFVVSLPRERAVREYHAALANDDHRTVRVIEGLPPSINPLLPEDRQKGRERKMQKLDAETAQKLDGLRRRIGARQIAATTFRGLLRRA